MAVAECAHAVTHGGKEMTLTNRLVGRMLLASGMFAFPTLVQADSFALFSNPVPITLPDGTLQTNCADPTVLRSHNAKDAYWYAYCTTDSLNDQDVDANGNRRQHRLPGLRSLDLVHWESIGDAFVSLPSWAAPTAGLWAPDLEYRNGRYYLYYTVTDVADAVSGEAGCGSDNAIGVATSTSPAGPWVDAGGPVVAPRRAGGGCNFYWTYDPDVLVDATGAAYLYYGSYYGGIEARSLSADGLTANGPATPITIPNRYEGAQVVAYGNRYYLFASASNCCNGPLTGYQVFAGRSTSPLGPFVDAQGVSLLDGQVGGSPVLTLNGNRWVGPGHNSVFQDAAGKWWTAYHAIDENAPYFAGNVGYTRRPLLLDRLDWVDGWPRVRQGLGPSDTPQLIPAGQPWIHEGVPSYAYDPQSFLLSIDALKPSQLVLRPAFSDEFDTGLGKQWSWVRPPVSGAGVSGGDFLFATQSADLNGSNNTASVLTEPAPTGNYMVETKLTLDVPANGCCQNYVQAGLVVYADDDDYIKLAHVSIWETRQAEFAKEVAHPAPGYPAYGSGVGGAVATTMWLRIFKVSLKGVDSYVSSTSRDGTTWVRGGTWTHSLGASPKIGLVSMGGSGFTATFEYVRVYGQAP